jgi:SpoVK/Ycf46/Vps4 family AAA+-type ATPase
MEKDMSVIDDPNDELAIESINLAKQSESECNNTTYSKSKSALPLIIFVRTDNTSSILKSKSAIERLVEMSRDAESIHMLILGRNPPPARQLTPQSPSATPQTNPFFLPSQNAHMMGNNSPDGSKMSPFSNPSNPFSFGPNNNASGQNDPEGSRRFNIFLARTMDASGPGIMGAIAPPEAGNLFPQMFAMQNQKMEPHIPFFNASITANPSAPSQPFNPADLTPEVMQKMIQATMSNVIERLSQLAKEQDALPTPLAKAFAEVLSNDNLKRGIGDNLARAAPALVDPRCQGVMLSVYVPPPQDHPNRGMMPKNGKDGGDSGPNNSGSVMGAWLNKILQNKDNEASTTGTTSSSKKKRTKNDNHKKGQDDTTNAKATDTRQKRGLTCLQLLCRQITLPTPSDPVRARGWQNWKARETGALTFRKNRRALQQQLRLWQLKILPTTQKSSSLRQMLSVKDITADMPKVVRTAVEIEASKAQAHREAGVEMIRTDGSGNVTTNSSLLHHLHPSSLITALSWACHITPSPSGSTSATSSTPVTPRRSRDDIQSLAQDKHERALVSQVVSPQDIGVTYDMIGGLHDVKELLRQSITYPLKYPQLYTEGIAREAVKGVLLFGPPGTGKTMLAKAVATEGGATFLSVDASSVENKWLGESEKNAKAVFTLARRLAPCVIFLDEVDSLLSSREGSGDDSAHGTLTSVKTTMMSEWDGLNSGTNGINGGDRVIVIGSTNRPFDLDEAVLRRFPRRILVDLPDLETRTEILEVTLAENRLSESVNLTTIAERLEGYTGSDIKEVCREAVVQISHEQARLLDAGLEIEDENAEEGNSSKPMPSLQRLRPVKMEDFDKAVGKLKKSVSEKGRELARVWEWNDEYGEIKKKDGRDKLPQLMNMFL